jgi:hypothetical protein
MAVRITFLCLIAWLAIGAGPALSAGREAGQAIAISSLKDGLSLTGHAEFLTDADGDLSLDAVLTSDDWQPVTDGTRKRGLTDAKIWMRFRVINDTGGAQAIIVTHDIVRLTRFTAFSVAPGGDTVRFTYDPM